MFVVVLILLVSGCEEPDSETIVVPEVTNDHLFYFDVFYSNTVGDFQLFGTYVDSEGNVVAYDHSFGTWTIGSPWKVTVAELNEKFSVPTDTLGVINPVTLAKMYGKVEAASLGDMIGSGYTGDGPGILSYCCHVYDKDVGGYVQVVFKQVGDFSRSNSSQEAQDLVVWLDSVVSPAVGGD